MKHLRETVETGEPTNNMVTGRGGNHGLIGLIKEEDNYVNLSKFNSKTEVIDCQKCIEELMETDEFRKLISKVHKEQ